MILSPSFSFLTLKVGNGDGVPAVLDFLSGGVGSVFTFFAMMELESPAPSNALLAARLVVGLDCPDGGVAGDPKLVAPSAANPVEGFQNDDVLLVNCRASLMLPGAWFNVCCWYCWKPAGEEGFAAADDGSVRLRSSEEVRKPPDGEVGDDSSSSPRLDRNWWFGSWGSCSIKLLLFDEGLLRLRCPRSLLEFM